MLGEEALLFVAPDGAEQRVAVHGGGILAVASDGTRILTGGDDGKVVATNAKGDSETLATDAKHRWIDRVALGPDGAIAWSAGKQAFVRTAKGEIKSLDLPSSVGGLAFAPKGLRLAIAHYGGVTLWFPERTGRARDARLEGLAPRRRCSARTASSSSPPCRSRRCTAGGWWTRKDMRMSGYSAQGALDGLDGGRQVARDRRAPSSSSSGRSPRKDGPMGKQPRMVAPYDKRAVAVACHPKQEIVAAGFEDGLVMLVPHRRRRGDSGEEARQRRRSRRSPGAPMARSSRSGPRTARRGSWIWRDSAPSKRPESRMTIAA